MNKDPSTAIPKGRAATLFGGVAVVAAGLAAWWIGLNLRQARKEESDPSTSAFVPTWEYRLLQAQRPPITTEKPATLRESDVEPPPHSPTGVQTSPERAERAVPGAQQTKSGQSQTPDAS